MHAQRWRLSSQRAYHGERLKVSMDTQIALGNLASQPDYKTIVVKKFIEPALAMK
jgi:NitT/TauT family transport system substrate-binding protein